MKTKSKTIAEKNSRPSDPRHFIAVEVKYYGPTNNKPSRLRLSLPRARGWTELKRLFISRDDEFTHGIDQAAEMIFEKTGIAPIGSADMGATDALLYEFYDSGTEDNNWVKLSGLFE